MGEQRKTEREHTITPPISCLLELADGTVLEGMVRDISDGGARVSASVDGLKQGDELQLALVLQFGQKIVYRAEVKHVDPQGEFFGLKFTSSPQSVNVG
jgi:hypothetical protein